MGGGVPAAIGATVGAGRIGYSTGKHLMEKGRHSRDLTRRYNEAGLLTRPIAEQPDLLTALRARANEISGGKKPVNLLSSQVFRALPR